MIKFVTIIVCVYVLYRLIAPPKAINGSNKQEAKVIDIEHEEVND
jgi:hypothetical protein